MASSHEHLGESKEDTRKEVEWIDYSAPMTIGMDAMNEKQIADFKTMLPLFADNPALNADQLLLMGRYYYSIKDVWQAKDYIKRAQDKGSAQALFYLGVLCQQANPPEEKRAAEYFAEAIKLKEPRAYVNLGVIHYRSSKEGKSKAHECFKNAAEMKVPEGCYNYALLCKEDKNIDLANKWFKIAADLGISRAFICLGIITGSDTYYSKAALAGDFRGFTEMFMRHQSVTWLGEKLINENYKDKTGVLYVLFGDFFDGDKQIKYYKKAALCDNPYGYYKAGMCLIKSPEVINTNTKQLQEGLDLILKGAMLGSYDALRVIRKEKNRSNWLDDADRSEIRNNYMRAIFLCFLKNFDKVDFKITDEEIAFLKELDAKSPDLKDMRIVDKCNFGIKLHALLNTYHVKPRILDKFFTRVRAEDDIKNELLLLAYSFIREAASAKDDSAVKEARSFMIINFSPSELKGFAPEYLQSPCPKSKDVTDTYAKMLDETFSAKTPGEFAALANELIIYYKSEKLKAEKVESKESKESKTSASLSEQSIFSPMEKKADDNEKTLTRLRVAFNEVELHATTHELEDDIAKINSMKDLLNPGLEVEIDDQYIKKIIEELATFKFGEKVFNEANKLPKTPNP